MSFVFRSACFAAVLITAHIAQAESPPLAEPVVQALQRTLNARLLPAPALKVDGKLGPETTEALKEFQRSQKLESTGEANPETFRALGPLRFTDAAPPTLESVNDATLIVEPSETLDGPPVTTCKAWAIGDGKSGEILWGGQATAKLPMASTTKIMTAYLVCQLAAADSDALDEMVTISAVADKTSGSTADIREREQLPVGELLYGLMLPSGNDVGIALAEHFGGRVAKAALPEADERTDDKRTPLEQFVAAMNAQAQELGMAQTRYLDPHGLSPNEHVSSARDLVKLAFAALKNPHFQKYVTTRQRAVTVTGPGGYLRTIVWKNTNEMLSRAGYSGVKTGTTGSAGACLVSRGSYEGDELIVAVLGSTSPDARYIDSRNLFRWAWQERREKRAGGN